MSGRLAGFGKALYNPKRKELLGRDGGRWAKLGVFYFFFYLGLAGFFCAMLAIFMAFTPRDEPRYILSASRMETRSNPLSPGLGFRPQPEVDKNLVVVNRNELDDQSNRYVENLDNYLAVYYPKQDRVAKPENEELSNENVKQRQLQTPKFSINNPYECTDSTKYGFRVGRPCILVKMNKIVDFVPKPGASSKEDEELLRNACGGKRDSIAVHCSGEYPADVDNIGKVTYISESGVDYRCGSLNPNRFPYKGKYDRQDFYQAPYVWAQFTNPKPNVLINVICRVFGSNIPFDKKTGRALTRFQLFVEGPPNGRRSRDVGEI